MKVLVCGGRDFFNQDFVNKVLDELNAAKRITQIIHGDADGADTAAEVWAKSRYIRSHPFPIHDTDWKKFGTKAGPIRNLRMLLEAKPDLVVAFPGKKGTADMIKQATQHNVEVKRFTVDK